MKSNEFIFWHQGLFLQPQHFQILDKNTHKVLENALLASNTYFWGVDTCSIDQELLDSGIFAINALKVLFQDASVAEYPGNAFIQKRDFLEKWGDKEKPLKIFIGLKKFKEKENASIIDGTDALGKYDTRYVSNQDPAEFKDIYINGPVANIKSMHYLIRIFFEDELKNSPEYMLLPIAQIVYKKGEIGLEKDFSYPAFQVKAAEPMQKIAESIKDLLSSRCRQLQEFKSPKSLKTTMDGNYFFYMLALQVLNRYFPALKLEMEHKNPHPYDLYKLFAQLIGELSMFTDRIDMLGRTKKGEELLSDYDHEEPYASFASAKLLIEELLDALIVGPEYLIPFEREGDMFTCAIDNSVFMSQNSYYLVIKSKYGYEKVLSDFKEINKVGTKENMDTLIKRALPGLAVRRVDTPPHGLPKREDMLYLSIDISSNLWLDVKKYQNITIHYNNADEDMSMHLAVIKGS